MSPVLCNATGFTLFGRELVPKRLELLYELVPKAAKIAVLVNSNNLVLSQEDIRDSQAAAGRLGLEIIIVNGSDESAIDEAFATAVQERAAAFL